MTRTLRAREDFLASGKSAGAWERFSIGHRRHCAGRRDIVREGELAEFGVVLRSGWACRYKAMGDGRRQILAFCIPGDLVELGCLRGEDADHAISAITNVDVVSVSHDMVENMAADDPDLAGALRRNAMIAMSLQREWMVSLGMRTAIERVANLFCELLLRTQQAGLAAGDGFALPLTQVDLGDALGLTSVHINRMVRALRVQGLIVIEGGRLEILNLPTLKRIAQFDGSRISRTDGLPIRAAGF